MTSTPEGLEHLKEDVRRKLSELDLNELTQVSGELSLTIPEGKETKKSAVYNLIARHLMSQEDDETDEGQAVFERCSQVVNQILELKAEAKTAGKAKKDEKGGESSLGGERDQVYESVEVKSTVMGGGLFNGGLHASAPVAQGSAHSAVNGTAAVNGTTASNGATASTDRVTLQWQKIREFKITGGVVGAEENGVDLTDIQFQMKEASDRGYTAREIRAGVIKAMKGGSEIRRYFERKVDKMDDTEFMEMLELWYTKKESSELMDAMAESVQGPKESEKKYVARMFDMRDHIMEVTVKEEDPLAYPYVQKKMLRALSVGLRRDVVRLQLITVLNEPNISDARILKELKGITTRDVENRNKMEKSGGKASVNALQDHSGGNSGFRREAAVSDRESVNKPGAADAISRIEQQLGQLSVTMSDMANGKTEVEERLKRLESKLLAGGGAGGGGGGARRDFPRCKACEPERKFCTHCKNCGESGHKQKECTKPKNC